MDTQTAMKRWWKDAEHDPIHEAAAEWFALLQDPVLPVEDTAAWQEWLAADPRHADAFRRIEEVWRHAAEIGDRGTARGEDYDPAVPISHWLAKAKPGEGRARWLALAASLLLAAAGASWWFVDHQSGRLATLVGESRTLTLKDGSQVALGGNSEIQVRMDDEMRLVKLLRGEAFFSVAKDPVRIFNVHAGDVTVQALGTAFNVRRGTERVVVSVIEGRVTVQATQSAAPMPLEAGHQAVAVKSEVRPAVALPNPEAVTAWKSGRLTFDREPLRYVLEDVNRYAPKRIVIEHEEIGDLLITGSVLSANVGGWVGSLQTAFGISAVADEERIVLRRPD